MAVDRKTGKPVPGPLALPDDYAFADYMADLRAAVDAEAGAFAGGATGAAPPGQPTPAPGAGADPRGVSVLRGLYGPWLFQEALRRAGLGL